MVSIIISLAFAFPSDCEAIRTLHVPVFVSSLILTLIVLKMIVLSMLLEVKTCLDTLMCMYVCTCDIS